MRFPSSDYSDEDDVDESVVVVEDDDDEGKSCLLAGLSLSDYFVLIWMPKHVSLTMKF